jgi:hypothetical protein
MRRYLIPWGRVFSSRGHAFDSAIVAAFYFVFKCVRCASGVSGGYVFESKVEVVNAFDSKILARAMGDSWRKTSEKRAKSEREASKKRARNERQASEKRGRSESAEEWLARRRPAGRAALGIDWRMAGLLSKIEKPARMGRLFLFFYYKFSISGWRG